MATQLKNILSFTGLVVGVPASIPHLLNIDEVAQVPDLVAPQQGYFIVAADDTNITVTRTAGDPDNVTVFAEVWHTEDRSFGPFANSQPESLTPRPFILRPGTGTSASPANAGITRIDGVAAALTDSTPLAFYSQRGPLGIDINYGMMKPGSIVGIYVLNDPLTGGTFVASAQIFVGSTGAPVATGATAGLAFGTADLFTNFATFAQGAFPYAAGDSIGIGWTTDAAFSGGEATGSVAAILLQDD